MLWTDYATIEATTYTHLTMHPPYTSHYLQHSTAADISRYISKSCTFGAAVLTMNDFPILSQARSTDSYPVASDLRPKPPINPTLLHQRFHLYLQSTRFSTPKHDTPYYTDGSIVLHVAFFFIFIFIFSLTGVKGRGGKIFFLLCSSPIYTYTKFTCPHSLAWSLFVWGLELSRSTARQI